MYLSITKNSTDGESPTARKVLPTLMDGPTPDQPALVPVHGRAGILSSLTSPHTALILSGKLLPPLPLRLRLSTDQGQCGLDVPTPFDQRTTRGIETDLVLLHVGLEICSIRKPLHPVAFDASLVRCVR